MKKIILSILFIMALFPFHASAANICTTPSGSGTQTGADWNNSASWSSLSWVRGNTYYLATGTYAAKNIATAVSGTIPIIIKKATAGDHVTDTGWTPSMGTGQAVIRPTMAITTSYITIDGVVPNGSVPDKNSADYGIKFQAASGCSGRFLQIPPTDTVNYLTDVTVKNIAFVGCNSVTGTCTYDRDEMGIFVRSFLSPYTENGAANNVSITNNYFGGFINSIFFMTMTNGLIAYNYFDSNASCPIINHGETINPAGNTNVTIRNNYFFDPYVAAIGGHRWNGSNDYIYIYNNIFKGNYAVTGKNVNMIIGNENDPDSDVYCHTYIYSNTILDMDVVAYGIIWIGPLVNCSQAIMRNNLFYGNSGAGFQYGGGNNVDHDYDYYSNNSSTPSETHGVNGGTSNPFNNYAEGDYSLKSTATAIDRGYALGSPFNIDYIGTSRPQGASWDIGAYEYVSATDIIPPSAPTGLAVQ